MALVNCPECQRQVSDKAPGCPNCGCPIAAKTPDIERSVGQNRCPYCRSSRFEIVGQDKSSFSVGKALGGAILTGGIGVLAGFIGTKGDFQCHCQECGSMFTLSKHAVKSSGEISL